ncbi:MAG TPA: M48 family metallopeptidase, partial [Candidatus Acidoferrum sp.]|nr:M48 family metallopeptidase [Candidatus Acidoferrum sp.]
MPASRVRSLIATFALCALGCLPALAQRTQLKPGWNLFSPQQDVQVGKQAASDAQRKLPMCNSKRADAYLTQLGKRLTDHLNTNGVQYPWEFHCVNDRSINAFALPGGYVFVNRGAIEAADNEGELAAVMAHELSHVALRHGTNQATKAQAAQAGVGIFGAIFGGSTGGALLTQLGSFTAGGVLLKYSRSAETQADVMGTQVLYDAGYDPRAMAQFFEKLEQETKGKNPPEFFSDHPSPDHRVERVNEEIDKLGGIPANAQRDSAEFEGVKREVMKLPVVKKSVPRADAGGAGPAAPPPAPSERVTAYQNASLSLSYPDNWKRFGGDDNSAVFGPESGVVNDGSGHAALAYGLTVGSVIGQGTDGNGLESATQGFVNDLQKTNPNMKITRQAQSVKLNERPALSTYLVNDSPGGGKETDWIVTVARPDGMMYFVCTAPEGDFEIYR